jgi:peptidoglycan hydrolase CwlO-like protein
MRRPHIHLLLATVTTATVLVAGCATLSEDECRRADWYQIGERDGANGHRADRYESHREACLEFKIRPDPERYLAGRDLGLRRYCVPDNAVREGLAGRTYQGVCPPSISNPFAELNRVAYAVYQARNEVENLSSKIDSLEYERRSEKTSKDRHKEIRDAIRATERKLDRARDDLRYREMDLNRAVSMSPR